MSKPDSTDSSLVPVAAPEPLPPTTLMRLRFAEYYLETGNARESARRAGYGGSDRALDACASRMLNRDDVKNYLSAHLAKILPAEEARSILADIARSSIANFVKIDDKGQIAGWDFASERAQANLHTIKSLKMTRYGPEVTLYDKLGAISLIVRKSEDEDPETVKRRIAEAVLNMLPPAAKESILRAIADGAKEPAIEGEAVEEAPSLPARKAEQLAWLKELQAEAQAAVDAASLDEDALGEDAEDARVQ